MATLGLLPDAFAGTARRMRDAVAVVADSSQPAELTYSELAHRVDQLAGLLTAEGVSAESVVAVVLRRGLALPVALLAVLRASGCYLPLDPDDPRLPDLLARADAALVITQPHCADRIDGYRTVVLDDALTVLDGVAAATTIRQVLPDQAAYLIFTSGTTGEPKGVVVSHGAIAHQISWCQASFPLSNSDRMLHKAPITFDVSLWELCWPLVAGIPVVLAAPGGHRDVDYLVDVLRRQQITVAQFVPSMLGVIGHGAVVAENRDGLGRT